MFPATVFSLQTFSLLPSKSDWKPKVTERGRTHSSCFHLFVLPNICIHTTLQKILTQLYTSPHYLSLHITSPHHSKVFYPAWYLCGILIKALLHLSPGNSRIPRAISRLLRALRRFFLHFHPNLPLVLVLELVSLSPTKPWHFLLVSVFVEFQQNLGNLSRHFSPDLCYFRAGESPVEMSRTNMQPVPSIGDNTFL